ncbi:MAG: C1 family peptidase [Methanosphaera sp.]|nr:C1 family peptidase [Methanosphaera sp.]
MTLSVAAAADSNLTDKGSTSLAKKNTTTTAVKEAAAKNNSASYNTLQKEINKSEKSLTLKSDYRYTDSDSVNGVVLNKNNMVIDGKGHTIDGSGKARVFVVSAKNVVLKNMIITNGRSEVGSALGFTEGATLSTINVTFTNNYASNIGCIFLDENCKYTSTNDKFINCNSKNEGIVTLRGATVNINQGYFKSKYTLNKGFISSIYTSRIDVSNTTFTNTQSKYSTAIFGDRYTSIKNSKFINLESELTGGAIILKNENKTLIINNCEFRNVTSGNNGGAIFVDAPGSQKTTGTTTITNTRFIKCRSNFGGAILQLGGKLNISKCNFNSNRAIYDGGAVYTSAANTIISNSEFVNNQNILTDYDGSSIYFDNGVLSIKCSKFTNNKGQSGIYLYDSKYDLTGNTFKSNNMAVYAVFSSGTFKSNNLNNDKISLKNTYYPTVVTDEGIEISIKNPIKNVSKLPSQYDSRKLGYVTPVKNQGEKNSCWAFGANAAIESSLLKTTKEEYDLSENTVVNTRLKYSRYGDAYVTEFNSETAPTGHMVSWLGTFDQDYDPYDEHGKISELTSTEDNIHIQDILYIPGNSKNIMNEMKQAIYKYGAISGTIYSTTDNKYYNPKTAAFYSYGKVNINHVITLVGWDDNYSKSNFATTPKANGAWIVKNSYGTEYGDKGYIYVSYYDESIYQETKTAYIFTNTIKYNKNYQTDFTGMDDYLTPLNGNVIYYANTYNMTDEDYLGAVGTWFNAKGVKYSFRVVVNDKLIHQQTGTSPYIGYSTIKLTKLLPVKTNDEVQIIFQSNAIPVETSSRVHYQEETSIFSVDGNDWSDLIDRDSTAVLKLYTVDQKSINKISSGSSNSKKGYSAVLYDGKGSALADTEVKFIVNDKEYTAKTNELGVAVLDKKFDNKKYNIQIINPDTEEIFTDYLDFEEYGNNVPYNKITPQKRTNRNIPEKTILKHVAAQSPKTLKVTKKLESKKNTIEYDTHDCYRAKFYDNNGNVLKNSKVKFIVDGIEYEKTTDENGVATLDEILSAGKHTVTIINEETGEVVTYEIEVKASIIENQDMECQEYDNSTFKVRVIGENGNAVKSGETVVFKINGKPFEEETDEDGYASLEIKEQPGNYTITATYNNYTTTNKLTVK